MLRPAIATVLSPRPWEPELVEAIAASGLVRLVARCYNPADVPLVDALVVGTETPWLDAARISRWHGAGITVVGMFALGDPVAVNLLCRSQVEQLFVETVDPIVILRAIRDLTAEPVRTGAAGKPNVARFDVEP